MADPNMNLITRCGLPVLVRALHFSSRARIMSNGDDTIYRRDNEELEYVILRHQLEANRNALLQMTNNWDDEKLE